MKAESVGVKTTIILLPFWSSQTKQHRPAGFYAKLAAQLTLQGLVLAGDEIGTETLQESCAQGRAHAIHVVQFRMHKQRVVMILLRVSHANSSVGHGKSLAEAEHYVCDAAPAEIKINIAADTKKGTVNQHRHRQGFTLLQHLVHSRMYIAQIRKRQTDYHCIIGIQDIVFKMAPTVAVAPGQFMIEILTAEASEPALAISHVELVKGFGSALTETTVSKYLKSYDAIIPRGLNPVMIVLQEFLDHCIGVQTRQRQGCAQDFESLGILYSPGRTVGQASFVIGRFLHNQICMTLDQS